MRDSGGAVDMVARWKPLGVSRVLERMAATKREAF